MQAVTAAPTIHGAALPAVGSRLSSLSASGVAFIASPKSGALHIGSLQLRAYGLMIALGVIAAVALAGRRLEWAGTGKREDIAAAAMWGVPAGVIGARLYHVITDWRSFRGDWLRAFKIWEGGLGIWGGIGLGVLVGLSAARHRGVRTLDTLSAVAPALPLAQAIGRWGNWWNQELFGKPTTLPWGLKIDIANRPPAYATFNTFHPTFLYESVWNLLLCVALLQIDRQSRPRGDRLFAMYVAGYTFMRFFLEQLRVDQASKIAGLRVNEWVSALVFVAAIAYLFVTRHAPARSLAGMTPVEADGEEGVEEGVGDTALHEDHAAPIDDGVALVDDDVAPVDEDVAGGDDATLDGEVAAEPAETVSTIVDDASGDAVNARADDGH